MREDELMNILYFLTPKNRVANIHDDSNLRQLMEKLEYHRYTAIPIIDKDGKYVGTVSEGDVLRVIKNRFDMNLQSAQSIFVKDIPRRTEVKPVKADASMNDIFEIAITQNFVPVTDDNDVFIGIITRRDVLRYLLDKNAGA